MASTSTPKVGTIGLIALNRDVVIEDDLHRLAGSDAGMVTTRIPLTEVGSIESLKLLESHIGQATSLLLPSSPSVIAFGCTSGVAAIGAARVHEEIARIGGGIASVDPLSAMSEGLELLGTEAIALVTPYRKDVSELMADWFETAGFRVVANARIDTSGVSHYADIPADRVVEAVERTADPRTRATVIGCTDLRVLNIIGDLEALTGAPVLTSNQALAWSAFRAVGARVRGVGRLFSIAS